MRSLLLAIAGNLSKDFTAKKRKEIVNFTNVLRKESFFFIFFSISFFPLSFSLLFSCDHSRKNLVTLLTRRPNIYIEQSGENEAEIIRKNINHTPTRKKNHTKFIKKRTRGDFSTTIPRHIII